MSTTTMSTSHYVPIHRRSSSGTRPSSVRIYSIQDLLALAPPSYLHGTELPSSSSMSSSPASSNSSVASPEPHQGWTKLNEAMRRFLRATSPEIAMNRKMRKSLEFHQYHQRQEQQQQRKPRPNSPASSSSGASPERKPTSSRSTAPVRPSPAPKQSAPIPIRPPNQPTMAIFQRSRSPTLRRVYPRNHNFTNLRLNGAEIAASASRDGNWRTVTRRPHTAFNAPLSVISVV